MGGQVNLVPADVRHFEASGAQTRGAAAQHAQAVDPALGVGRAVKLAVGALVPTLKEQLQAQADAEKRHAAAHGLANRVGLAGLVHVRHGVLEAAHAGQHDARGARDDCRVVRDARLSPDLGKAANDGEEVALVVVDHDDRRCH